MTNAEARFNKSLRPRKPEGSLGRTAQDVHLDSHTAPELTMSRVRRDWAGLADSRGGSSDRIRFGSPFSVLKSCSLWTLFCQWLTQFVPRNLWNIKMALYRRLPIRNAWLVVILVSGDHRCSQWQVLIEFPSSPTAIPSHPLLGPVPNKPYGFCGR